MHGTEQHHYDWRQRIEPNVNQENGTAPFASKGPKVEKLLQRAKAQV